MVFVVRVEVKLSHLNLVFAATPDDRTPESHRESGFVVDSRLLPGKVRNHELAISDLGYDLVRDLVIVLLLIDPNRLETRLKSPVL